MSAQSNLEIVFPLIFQVKSGQSTLGTLYLPAVTFREMWTRHLVNLSLNGKKT